MVQETEMFNVNGAFYIHGKLLFLYRILRKLIGWREIKCAFLNVSLMKQNGCWVIWLDGALSQLIQPELPQLAFSLSRILSKKILPANSILNFSLKLFDFSLSLFCRFSFPSFPWRYRLSLWRFQAQSYENFWHFPFAFCRFACVETPNFRN